MGAFFIWVKCISESAPNPDDGGICAHRTQTAVRAEKELGTLAVPIMITPGGGAKSLGLFVDGPRVHIDVKFFRFLKF